MDAKQAVVKLASLAQETRLRIFRLLVETGKDGMNASAIAEALELAPATLSFHVAHLTRSGLVNARQESRFIYYSVKWWNTLHQGSTIKFSDTSMHVAMKQALFVMMAACWLYAIAITLVRVRSIILERERNTQWVSELDEVRS